MLDFPGTRDAGPQAKSAATNDVLSALFMVSLSIASIELFIW
jgi:hypothetical protein